MFGLDKVHTKNEADKTKKYPKNLNSTGLFSGAAVALRYFFGFLYVAQSVCDA